jgi:hypothetical protein
MRIAQISVLLATLVAAAPAAQAQSVERPAAAGQLKTDDIVDRMNQSERAVLDRLKNTRSSRCIQNSRSTSRVDGCR